MGNCTTVKDLEDNTIEIINNNKFSYKQIIGRGGFSRVWIV